MCNIILSANRDYSTSSHSSICSFFTTSIVVPASASAPYWKGAETEGSPVIPDFNGIEIFSALVMLVVDLLYIVIIPY